MVRLFLRSILHGERYAELFQPGLLVHRAPVIQEVCVARMGAAHFACVLDRTGVLLGARHKLG